MEAEIRVRGYHTDLYQHVNNARYLEFLEEGRWQALEKYLGLDLFINREFSFFAVNINISYKAQARVNDVLIIRTGLDKIKNKSAVFRQHVFNKKSGKLCVEADTTFVIADSNGKALKLEGALRQKLEKLPKFSRD